MPSLLTGAIDFSLSSLASLSTTQLALARLHPDSEESDALRICQLFFHRREKARQAQEQRAAAGQGGGGSKPDQDEEARFALVGLDFALDDKLEGLNAAQLAAVVVLAHPDASELQVLKAERIWRKRREKAAQAQAGQVDAARKSVAEKSRAQETHQASTDRPSNLPNVAKPSAPAPRPPTPPLPAPPPRPTQPPQATAIATRSQKSSPRSLPPLPPVGTRIPDTLCQEIYSLKLSNLPVVEIKTRDDVSSLFPRHLLPDAVILHRPLDVEDVSRTAYVGWVFDFEKRTEAMQEVIRVRMGRWRAVAEFVECEKPKWEWGDLAKVKRQHAWKAWNEKEQEREDEAARKQLAGGNAVMVVPGSSHAGDHVEEEGYLVPPASDDIDPPTFGEDVAPLPMHAVPGSDAEPEAIVLDSPALPPIPSRAPSRAGSSRNDANNSFQPPPSEPPSPVSFAPTSSQSIPSSARAQDLRGSRPSHSRPTSPRRTPPTNLQADPTPAQRRDAPPPVVARPAPTNRPQPVSASSSNAVPLRAPAPLTTTRQPPQFVDSLPPRPQAPAQNPPTQNPTRTLPSAPPPSLLARTTEIEVRGSAPTSSSAAQAKRPSLIDRLDRSGAASSSTKSSSPPVVVAARGQSPASNARQNLPAASSKASPGPSRGGGGNANNPSGRRRGSSSQLPNANSTAQGSSASSKDSRAAQGQSHSHQQQQQQQQSNKGKKRAANSDLETRDGTPRGGGGGVSGVASASLSDRIEGYGNGREPAKKARNGPTSGGGNSNRSTKGTEQGGGSLLSRLG
ncbi:hypothetical protein JCM11491_003679 [Sporobolomyces phaffii]